MEKDLDTEKSQALAEKLLGPIQAVIDRVRVNNPLTHYIKGGVSVKLSNDPIEVWLVTKDQEWARFFIQHGRNKKGKYDNTWVDITIASSFGSWHYHWGYCGDYPNWWEFFRPEEIDYVMGKFMGDNAKIFDLEVSMKEAFATILNDRRCDVITKEGARSVYEDLHHIKNSGDMSEGTFLNALGDIPWFTDDYWERSFSTINPTAQAFWDHLWVPWIEGVAELG